MVDLSGDQLLIDDLEAVELNISLTGATWDLPDAYRVRDEIVEGDPSEGGYLHRETTWHLSTLQAYVPAIGDTIIDAAGAGLTWVIQSVGTPTVHNDAWRIRARELTITADATLADLVTLHPSVDTLTEWGSKVSDHTAAFGAFSDVAAKIVLRASVPDDYAGKKQFVQVYDIYVDQQLPQLHNGDLIEDGDGNNYTIVSWRNRELIDELSVIECELRPRKP